MSGVQAAPAVETERGNVVWHCSEEDAATPDVGMTLGLGGGKMLWAGEISAALHARGGPEAAALGDDGGWWLVLYPGQQILARCICAETGRELIETLAASISPGGAP